MEIKKEKPLWVVVFLRGGMDGLSFVYPNSGKDREVYEAERPTVKISPSAKDLELKLNDRFSLHPSAKELHTLYQKKNLAFVHAVGLMGDSRSHFDAQNLMEQGAVSKAHLLHSGWIARYLQKTKSEGRLTAVSIGQNTPTSVYTYDHGLVIDALRAHHWAVPPKLEGDFEKAVRAMYALEAPNKPWLSDWGIQTLDTLSSLKEVSEQKVNDSEYPKGELGGKLQTLARLVDAKPEVQIATVDMGGWDTHKYQGSGSEGTFGSNVAQLSKSLALFYDQVSKKRPVIITVQTEFGRRLKENSSRGTDHGHGGVMMVIGDRVKGGEIYGKWPGLETNSLYQRADLAVTTDYRAVLSEILKQSYGFQDLKSVFPEFKMGQKLGLID